MENWSGKGVLLAEDDYFIAESVATELEMSGIGPIFIAPSVAAGRAILRKEVIGLAILDINLGDELVYPLAAELAERKVPIIFHTAMSRETVMEPWSSHPILQKPADQLELVSLATAFGLARDVSAVPRPAGQPMRQGH